MNLEFESSHFGESYLKAVFDTDRNIQWNKREWEKFRDEVDEYFRLREKKATNVMKGDLKNEF